MQPQQFSLREDQIGHRTVDHRVWGLPASIAQVEDASTGVAVVDEYGLLSRRALEIAEVLIRTEVIDVWRCSRRGRMVIAYEQERSITLVGLTHEWVQSVVCRLTVGWPSATS